MDQKNPGLAERSMAADCKSAGFIPTKVQILDRDLDNDKNNFGNRLVRYYKIGLHESLDF